MKRLFLLTIITLVSCNRKEVNPFDSFTFSDAGLHHDYSMKFTNSDTIYLQTRFPSSVENYYAIITKEDRKNLNQFIEKLNFKKYDTIYAQENLDDGRSLLFRILNRKENHWIFIYGHNGPKELFEFAKWLTNFKEKQKFKPSSKASDYGNLKYILPPPPPPKIDTITNK
jgi:hypothetical protein